MDDPLVMSSSHKVLNIDQVRGQRSAKGRGSRQLQMLGPCYHDMGSFSEREGREGRHRSDMVGPGHRNG